MIGKPVFNLNEKINWTYLSLNLNTMHILEQNFDKINWWNLSLNSNAIHILEQNLDKIEWYCLSQNENAIYLLEQNLDKIDWYCLSLNPNAIHLFAPLNHIQMKENNKYFFEELVSYVFNPLRISRFSEIYNMDEIEYLENL